MKKSINYNKLNFFLLSFFTILVSIIRILQLQYFTDFNLACDNFKTINFFNFDITLKKLSCFMYIISAIYLVLLIFFNCKNKKDIITVYDDSFKNSFFIKISLVLLSILIAVNSILYIINLKDRYLKLKSYDLIITIFIFQIMIIVYFLYIFYSLHCKKFNQKSIANLIFLFPVILGLIRIYGFLYLNQYFFLTPRIILFSNLQLICISLFFVYFGKMLIGFNHKKNNKNLILFGFLSIFFGLNNVLPRTIVYFLNLTNLKINNTSTYNYNINFLKATNFIFMDLIIILFISTFLFKIIFNNSYKKTHKNNV